MADHMDTKYLPELMAEKDSIDPSFIHAVRLISKEIDNIKNPAPKDDEKSKEENIEFADVFDPKPPKLTVNIKIPTEEFPQVNFVGRLIGPGGATLKGIQEVTSTKISILGKGSVRDRKKTDENDKKYSHLKLPLHVKITAFGALGQAHINLGRGIAEITKLLQVDDEEFVDPTGAQMMGRMGQRGGGKVGGGGMMRGRGRGGTGGRGGPMGARGGSGVRGSMRGGAGHRGAQRGGRGQFGKAQITQIPQQVVDPYAGQASEYGYEYAGNEYEYDAYADYDMSYDPMYAGEEYAEAYATEGSYGADASYGQDFAYEESYDAYGGNAAVETGASYMAQKPHRGKMRGGGPRRGATKPY
ncbi:uncharacterized protein LOC143448413 isoform X2 [Clavelina lepadiformis]|uniref:uncharacterized protein LOC143448413 isoform X2 n=1 Tax=Clavelina lepadiformis TaxID=159417 RepID=UPI004042480F